MGAVCAQAKIIEALPENPCVCQDASSSCTSAGGSSCMTKQLPVLADGQEEVQTVANGDALSRGPSPSHHDAFHLEKTRRTWGGLGCEDGQVSDVASDAGTASAASSASEASGGGVKSPKKPKKKKLTGTSGMVKPTKTLG
eukprot:Skav207111  [mRNA]  locus=scaffold156:178673:186320:- [translate_table: standard]